jgi:hypothetical protein
MGGIAGDRLWCINNPDRPKSVRIASALSYQAYDYHGILHDLFYRYEFQLIENKQNKHSILKIDYKTIHSTKTVGILLALSCLAGILP